MNNFALHQKLEIFWYMLIQKIKFPLEMLTLVYVWSIFVPREDFLNLARHKGLPG